MISSKIRLVILLTGCLSFCFTAYAQPSAKDGVLDLRQNDLDGEVELNGEWQFYWQQFVNPAAIPAKSDVRVQFPFLWNGYLLNGHKLPSFGYASYVLTIVMPKHTAPLRMSVPDVYCAYRLYLNGKLIASNGNATQGPDGFRAHWQYRAVDLPANTDTLRLVLHVSNFVHYRGGVKSPLALGPKAPMELARQRSEAIDLLLTGCLFMGGLFFLGLYIFGNRDKAVLMFSLYAIVYSYRIIGTDNYVLHSLFPDLNWYVAVRLEYMSLFAGIGIFGLYCRYLYPADSNKKVIAAITIVCFVFTGISLFFPAYYFSQLVNPFLVVMVFCLVYVPYLYIKAWRLKRPGSIYSLASSLALMGVFAISLLHYWNIVPQLQLLSFIGYISFFFLQSLVLSHRVSFVLTRARHEAEQGLVAKSEFLSTMSHEIRTPLNSVIGIGHLLLENDPRPDQQAQLQTMIFSANNLLGIVNDILDYNKIEAGMVTFENIPTDLPAIARNIVNSLATIAQDKAIDLRLNIDSELDFMVNADPTRIAQVLTNLVHNAIKFTNTGEVLVTLGLKKRSETELTVRFGVRDTGIGISLKNQALIFDRFTQADSSTSRSFGGTGLGLAISKRLLELQDSQLHLESEEGKGAYFYFDQIFAPGGQSLMVAAPAGQAPANPAAFSGLSILLVEDNILNVMVVQTFLKRRGAVIDVAGNGQEALAMLDTSKHRLILMDLHMPVMDGYEAARRIRAKGITIPIIALTANLPQDIQDEVHAAGIDDIVVKPFLPDELYRKVLHYVS
ncbi:ATP-binding protein [Mucilaginibacter sp. UYCu711]|uniref:ATP-binding protein n=1 Tax=Mucilaginibacter sp. UYCu711 TaxID=3156339 RepID=UPI003D26181F